MRTYRVQFGHPRCWLQWGCVPRPILRSTTSFFEPWFLGEESNNHLTLEMMTSYEGGGMKIPRIVFRLWSWIDAVWQTRIIQRNSLISFWSEESPSTQKGSRNVPRGSKFQTDDIKKGIEIGIWGSWFGKCNHIECVMKCPLYFFIAKSNQYGYSLFM